MTGLAESMKTSEWFRTALIAVIAGSFAYCVLPDYVVARTFPALAPERVDEEMFVRIGGIEQWITIKGDDHNNPVVLFLHGGPGDALSPFADAMFADGRRTSPLSNGTSGALAEPTARAAHRSSRP